MVRSIQAFIVFACTLLLAGLIIAAGASFTFEKLSDAVAAAPVKTGMRPSYVASLPAVRATDLDIAKFVPVEPVGAPAAAAVQAPPALTHEVAVDRLWVRAGPDKRSARVVALERGTRLSVTGSEGRWAAVTGPNGGRGWVYSDYIRPLSR